MSLTIISLSRKRRAENLFLLLDMGGGIIVAVVYDAITFSKDSNVVSPFSAQDSSGRLSHSRTAQGTPPDADGALREDRDRAIRPLPDGAGGVQGRPRHAVQDSPGLRFENGRVLRRDRESGGRAGPRARQRVPGALDRGAARGARFRPLQEAPAAGREAGAGFLWRIERERGRNILSSAREPLESRKRFS